MASLRTFGLLTLFGVLPGLVQSAGAEMRDQLRAIENRYNRAQSLRLTFSESYAGARRPARTETATLWCS